MHMLQACISEVFVNLTFERKLPLQPPYIFLMLLFFFLQALRMQPPLIFLMREVLEDREYKGMTIPKGDKVFLSPSLAGRR